MVLYSRAKKSCFHTNQSQTLCCKVILVLLVLAACESVEYLIVDTILEGFQKGLHLTDSADSLAVRREHTY